ncbi:hypothetical protein D1970_17710, partial [Mesobacillus zeae]
RFQSQADRFPLALVDIRPMLIDFEPSLPAMPDILCKLIEIIYMLVYTGFSAYKTKYRRLFYLLIKIKIPFHGKGRKKEFNRY